MQSPRSKRRRRSVRRLAGECNGARAIRAQREDLVEPRGAGEQRRQPGAQRAGRIRASGKPGPQRPEAGRRHHQVPQPVRPANQDFAYGARPAHPARAAFPACASRLSPASSSRAAVHDGVDGQHPHARSRRTAAGARAARQRHSNRARGGLRPGAILDRIGRPEDLDDRGPHQRGDVEGTAVASEKEPTGRVERGEIGQGRRRRSQLGGAGSWTRRPPGPTRASDSAGPADTMHRKPWLGQAPRDLAPGFGRVALVGSRDGWCPGGSRSAPNPGPRTTAAAAKRLRPGSGRPAAPGHCSDGDVRDPCAVGMPRKRDQRCIAIETREPSRLDVRPAIGEAPRRLATRADGRSRPASAAPERRAIRPLFRIEWKSTTRSKRRRRRSADETSRLAEQRKRSPGSQRRLQLLAREEQHLIDTGLCTHRSSPRFARPARPAALSG